MTTDLLLNDLVKLFSDEDLIRFVRRAQLRGMPAVGELLSCERKTRESEYPAKNIELYAKDEEIARLKAEISEWMSTAQRLKSELMEAQTKIDELRKAVEW